MTNAELNNLIKEDKANKIPAKLTKQHLVEIFESMGYPLPASIDVAERAYKLVK